ncbi:hypothetical protein ACSCB1_24580 [Streptomyces europaeiscabiei]|uniref:hypothetical protein n=1 Tax=Streptomyces europaeiscabiei TaxID=146819 RepID=UPI0006284AE0|nr:hypothetical protein [Streptomyces europaeiscabiei]MDX2760964.1 hypothetical protein [Streptomyces europaeiscabiei]MDX3715233.1 hypothetical protein [Streptomyces europaeiscabiei]MDX3779586.1 hypothetical protein [Streptomyces europaeiscabiei]MDX3840849.1 hypothetical protein [Streptomyces europaeiscabiei]MDX3864880.1 hypothetical protein [Streptomyces europaeiscabiei]
MPRNRPGALRAAQRLRGDRPLSRDSPPRSRIHGLSARTSASVHRYEALSADYDVFPGMTASALRRYRAFAGAPGRRPRYPFLDDCGCRACALRDIRHVRDMLGTVLRHLPPRPRAELGRLVTSLDVRYLERTLPDPFVHVRRGWRPYVWWYRRLEGCRYAATGAV